MSDITQFGNYFTFGDVQSNSYGVWISGEGTFNAPERDFEMIQIPGRSGDLIKDNNRFNNIDITYPAFISAQFKSRFDTFKAALLSKGGYVSLEDTYHPESFRMAAFRGGIEPKTGPYNRNGSFNIVFECKPQRWLKSGLNPQTFTGADTITNPTLFEAKPNIRVYGYGTVTIGNVTITIQQNQLEYIDIDCEAMAAFKGAVNANSLVSMSSDSFPVLSPGTTGIRMTGNVASIQIQPRWWSV